MRLPRPRFTMRRMMVTVAIAGLVMGWAVHARHVLRDEDDFGYGILLIECIGVLMLSTFSLPIIFVIYLVRQDDAHAARLRRIEASEGTPMATVDDSVPQPEPSQLGVMGAIPKRGDPKGDVG